MGRSFLSVRQGINDIAGNWERMARDPDKGTDASCLCLADMAKKHSSELFSLFDDPVEAAIFSALVELLKEREDR